MPRLLIVATHPIQYLIPLFQRLASCSAIDLDVLYLTDFGVRPSYDPGFDAVMSFDIPLLNGYPYRILEEGVTTPLSRWHVPPLIRLLRELSAGEWDAVVVHGYATLASLLICVSAIVLGVPYLMRGDTQLEPDSAAWRTRSRRRVKRFLLGPLLRRAGACLAIGSRNREFYSSYGVPPERIFDAPLCVNTTFFEREGDIGRHDRNALLKSVGLDPSLPTVTFAGKLQTYKRPLDLLDALELTRADFNLIFIGDGPLREQLLHRSRATARVALLGFVNQSEIGRWYGASDVLVLPSAREPWGLVVTEAMAAGAVPIVSDAVGCAPDLVDSGPGSTYPPGDIGALAAALDRLLQEKENFITYRRLCRAIASGQAPEITARALEQSLLALSPPGPTRPRAKKGSK